MKIKNVWNHHPVILLLNLPIPILFPIYFSLGGGYPCPLRRPSCLQPLGLDKGWTNQLPSSRTASSNPGSLQKDVFKVEGIILPSPKTNSLNPPKKMLFLVFYFQFWKSIFFRCQLLVSGRVFPCKPPFWMTEVKSHLSSAVCTYLGSGGVVDQRRACIKFRVPFG